MAFENIIGNSKNKKVLTNIIEKNKILHCYLFSGKSGIGKKLFAKEFAKMILCQNQDKKSCNTCKSCIEFESNNNPDFNIVVPDGNSIKIEQIRFMQSKAYEKPIISNRKVYIIDEAERMTKEAQNCLLKTLEEPSDYITIIIICCLENNLLSTIKSRCMKLAFNKLDDEEIKMYLREKFGIEHIDNDIIKVFDGSLGNAVLFKDKIDIYKQVRDIIYNIDKKDIVDILNSAECLYKNKDDIYELLDYINIVLFDLLKERKYNNKYLKCINICENTKIKLKSNNNFDMTIDDLLISVWEEINKC
ncbi:MAG: DNA polymerase III subunit delta' [Clostridia bacterium]|nr:DNA polymerase III subunit delta' [Clostridia bacterium]